MEQCYFCTILFFLFFGHLNSQNSNFGNEIDFNKQKVITLGPPRRGLQRAVFDEVLTDGLVGEIPQAKNDIDAYDDDSLVDLRGEDPLFIPKPYREEKGEQKMKVSTVRAERIRTSSISTSTSFTTLARIPSTEPAGRTSASVMLTMRPSFSPQSPFRPLQTQSPPRREFLSPSAPRIGHRFETDSRTSFLVPTRPVIPTTPSSPRIDFRPPSHSTSDSLRTGVCHASIFYISTPTSSSQKHSFTHFAITVSTDQCARTCHEFNCAIAHYDPGTGRCQFNPSTAFSIREGQCPPWPTTHYRNNVQTNTPLRIFCVQCHRSFRRGQVSNQRSRIRTSALRPRYTGRLSNPLRRSGLARMHSELTKQQE